MTAGNLERGRRGTCSCFTSCMLIFPAKAVLPGKEPPAKATEQVCSDVAVASHRPWPRSTAAMDSSHFILRMALGETSLQTPVTLQGHARKASCTLKRMLEVQTPSNRDVRVKSRSYRCHYQAECLLWSLTGPRMLLFCPGLKLTHSLLIPYGDYQLITELKLDPLALLQATTTLGHWQ